jgi:hypothetical protein
MAGPLAEAILGTHYSAGFIGGVRVYQNVIDGWVTCSEPSFQTAALLNPNVPLFVCPERY